MSKPQLHVSMMNTMSRCGIQFQRRYGARFDIWDREEIIPPGTALLRGITVHKTVEANLTRKMTDGSLMSIEEVKDLARDSFERQVQNAELRLDETEAENPAKALAATRDQAIDMAALHAAELAPVIYPKAVEDKFVLELNGYPYDLAGTIDIIEATTDDGEVVRDTKTASKAPSQDAIRSIQLGMYAMTRQVLTGSAPKAIILDNLVSYKAGPKVVSIVGKPDDALMNATKARIKRSIEIIESVKSGKQAFAPANPDDWCCTKKWCGYAQSCPFWSGR